MTITGILPATQGSAVFAGTAVYTATGIAAVGLPVAIGRPRHAGLPVIGKRDMTVVQAKPRATKPPYESASDRCP